MNEKTNFKATTHLRDTTAHALSYLTPVVGLYTVFLMVPFVLGEEGYAGLAVVRAAARGIARLTMLGTEEASAAAFGPVPSSDRLDGLIHSGLYYFDGLAVCLAAAAGIMFIGKAASRVLFVGWDAFLKDVRSKGIVKAVAGSTS